MAKERVITTIEINARIKRLVAQELDNLPELIKQLTPSERLRLLTTLLQYSAPRVETCTKRYGENDWEMD